MVSVPFICRPLVRSGTALGTWSPSAWGICLISTYHGQRNSFVGNFVKFVSVPFICRPPLRSGTALGTWSPSAWGICLISTFVHDDCALLAQEAFQSPLGDLFNFYIQSCQSSALLIRKKRFSPLQGICLISTVMKKMKKVYFSSFSFSPLQGICLISTVNGLRM